MDRYRLPIRLRRNRRSPSIRALVRETRVTPDDLIWPLFVREGSGVREPIDSMPGCARLSIDVLVNEAREAHQLGIGAIALFPVIDRSLKDPTATEATNRGGLCQRAIHEIKEALPDLAVISDVAMDPYSSDGHDGLVLHGRVLNDETLEILAGMAISQAEAGADIIAPSDMMDGRVGYIREALDDAGFEEVGILAYSAKYASSLYAPFRNALESAPKSGDKKTYQMDPANAREALREVDLDYGEGADIVMVKPAGMYLDIIGLIRDHVELPLAAYQVSGEYAMIHAAGRQGWLDADAVMAESLLAIKRAGADMIFSYAARDFARGVDA